MATFLKDCNDSKGQGRLMIQPKKGGHHRDGDHPRDGGCLRDFYHPKGWLLIVWSIES